MWWLARVTERLSLGRAPVGATMFKFRELDFLERCRLPLLLLPAVICTGSIIIRRVVKKGKGRERNGKGGKRVQRQEFSVFVGTCSQLKGVDSLRREKRTNFSQPTQGPFMLFQFWRSICNGSLIRSGH